VEGKVDNMIVDEIDSAFILFDKINCKVYTNVNPEFDVIDHVAGAPL
jgi:hypothetical protein